MLNDFANTPFGEFCIFFGAILFVFMIGIVPMVIRVRAERNPSPWAFKISTVNTSQTMVGTPIDVLNTHEQLYSKNNAIEEKPNHNNVVALFEEATSENVDANGFDHSNVDLDELNESVNIILNEIENHKNEGFAITKEKITFFVGEKTADLITSGLENIEKGEQVVCGTFLANSLEVEFDSVTVPLSTIENIRIEDGEFVLIKGNMLPDGKFRVLHWDDPDNIEAGYGIEDFIVKQAV